MKIAFCCSDTAPGPWLAGLTAALPQARIEVWPDDGTPPAGHDGEPADYAVVWKPPQRFLNAQPRLKALFNAGAGVDALLPLTLPPGLPIIRLEDAGMAAQMSEYVLHTLLRHFREFDAFEASARAGVWADRVPRLHQDCPVGVMGLGVLGAHVAREVARFGFPVHGWSRSPRSIEGVRTYSGAQGLQEFLGATRVLVNLLPLTPETENLLNRGTLGRLQPGGYLINVARGGHVVDDDLLALLDSGHLAGATLDVFRTEPLPPEHPFWRHPRIHVTPHISALTLEDVSITQIADKLARFVRGEPVSGVVDPARGY
ncbi:glyoxylate/hydroxypyruvate reductase A [Oryzisolibacter propanilivorax]|uniref:Glyoxylate/hydroxypyruvate reductase A n=1 Tax=Oryzisolibacter propanilivorax TaxID=1527607 RepID=A0A1G9VJQ1_9BURK|nr:glyoxylate/hydroxypyruvate reductase A [Oryzisolibacter propanilivorax]SDM72452.1 glyoxylate/hydroxypyruvate reductase A [Oryzisolibacter propanilivorax]